MGKRGKRNSNKRQSSPWASRHSSPERHVANRHPMPPSPRDLDDSINVTIPPAPSSTSSTAAMLDSPIPPVDTITHMLQVLTQNQNNIEQNQRAIKINQEAIERLQRGHEEFKDQTKTKLAELNNEMTDLRRQAWEEVTLVRVHDGMIKEHEKKIARLTQQVLTVGENNSANSNNGDRAAEREVEITNVSLAPKPRKSTTTDSATGENVQEIKCLPKYDGTLDAIGFVKQCKTLMTAGQWSDKTLAVKLMMALQGKASEALSCLSEDQAVSGKAILELIEKRFGRRMTKSAAISKLQNRVQGKGESLASLSQEIAKLTQLAYSDANETTKATLEVTAFLNAIFNDDLQFELRRESPVDLSQALTKAEEIEQMLRSRRTARVMTVDTQQQESTTNNVNTTRYPRSNQQSSNALNNQRGQSFNNRGGQYSGRSYQQPYRPRILDNETHTPGAICTYCNIPNHTEAQCFRKQDNQRPLNMQGPAGQSPIQQAAATGRQ